MAKRKDEAINPDRNPGYVEADVQAQRVSRKLEAGEPADQQLVPKSDEGRGLPRNALGDPVVVHPDDQRVPNLPDHAMADQDDGLADNSEPPLPSADDLTNADKQILKDAYSKNDPGVETKK